MKIYYGKLSPERLKHNKIHRGNAVVEGTSIVMSRRPFNISGNPLQCTSLIHSHPDGRLFPETGGLRGLELAEEDTLRNGVVPRVTPLNKSKAAPIKGISVIKKNESKDPCLKLNIMFDKGRSSLINHQ